MPRKDFMAPKGFVVAVLVLVGSGCNQQGTNIQKPPEQTDAKFDPCESLRDTDPHCGWKPEWVHLGPIVSDMDGAKADYLDMDSIDPDGSDAGGLHYAQLRLRFENGKLRPGRHVAVGIAVHGMLESLSLDSEYDTPVRVKTTATCCSPTARRSNSHPS
jgi:hypothetical protein